jgi:hypothetical protein
VAAARVQAPPDVLSPAPAMTIGRDTTGSTPRAQATGAPALCVRAASLSEGCSWETAPTSTRALVGRLDAA